ncbi:MAG: hypothetical protein ACI8UZ_002844 [Akkermansiaceae bacterium]|jgi:hypothetical protein
MKKTAPTSLALVTFQMDGSTKPKAIDIPSGTENERK